MNAAGSALILAPKAFAQPQLPAMVFWLGKALIHSLRSGTVLVTNKIPKSGGAPRYLPAVQRLMTCPPRPFGVWLWTALPAVSFLSTTPAMR